MNYQINNTKTINEVYDLLSIDIQKIIPNSIIILNQLNEKKDEAYVYDLIGLNKPFFNKLIRILGINPVGKHFKNSEYGRKHFYTSKQFEQFNGKLYDFSDGIVSEWVCNLIESVFYLKNIYTIGLNYDNTIIGCLMVFPRKDDKHKLKDIQQRIPLYCNRMKVILEEYKSDIWGNDIQNNFSQAIINNISHEIRTPLNGIVGLMQAGLNLLETNEDTQHLTSKIWQNSNELTSKIDNLLLISNLQTNQTQFRFQDVSINEIIIKIEFLIRKIGTEFEGRKIHFIDRTTIRKHNYYRLDTYYFEVTLLEILRNAIKFSEDIVELSIDIKNTIMHINISDKGIGMTATEHADIFKLFNNNDQANNRGMGLGLPIVKEICNKHNWNINFLTELHIGTSVNISIPYLQ
ncbi:sensor histidine kinase [Labilibacter marinus]|uniref:sensor histidine kinase n=1 Tax=Labilibacter marinus TaxID=1477105 RepID=UPI0008340E73|nr:HAMP domain-containing sensor histidine kinase [Labilibacter marinus]